MKTSILAAAAICAALSTSIAHAADFGGAYIGGDLSYSSTNFGIGNSEGFSGGAVIGAGQQKGKWYMGGEIGAGLTNLKDDATNIDQKNYYTGAVRLGYTPNNKAMVYGLAGIQGAQFDTPVGTKSDYGYRFGLGVETFVKKNISLRNEVNYVDWQGQNGLSNKSEWKTSIGMAYRF